MIPSYSSIYTLGHAATKDFSTLTVDIEEKVDGSQFSFWVDPSTLNLECRSKGAVINTDHPEGMFSKAVKTAKDLENSIEIGFTYRCEYLRSPKHNTLSYSRVPDGNLILFDIESSLESPVAYDYKSEHAKSIGLETVPLLYSGPLHSAPLEEIMQRESVLGGCKIEGVVIKPHVALYGPDKRRVLAKLVNADFKEKHAMEWKKSNPTTADVIEGIIAALRTEARWRKAVQHIREDGRLEESPRDIGALLKEVQGDIEKEEAEAIKDALYRYAKPRIMRGVIRGLPEWYKATLAESVVGFAPQAEEVLE